MDFNEKWNVMPIKRGYTDYEENKKPLLKTWDKYKKEKFPRDELKKYEPCNYALICGTTSDNIIAIDLDFRNGNRYLSEIYPLFNTELGQLANTYAEHSPNGTHLFYRINGDVPRRRIYGNSKKKDVVNLLQRYTKTKYSDLLKSVDIMGENGYVLIYPSENNGMSYKKGMPFPIRDITNEEFLEIKEFFLLKKGEKKRLRKPFEDILLGKIEIENHAKTIGKDEHVIWKFLFREAWNYLGLHPHEIYPYLIKNQPAFDESKTEAQLTHHPYTENPMTNATLKEYFPTYDIKVKTKTLKIPPYVEISNDLMSKYDIITLRDQKETMMIRNGNIYSGKLEAFYNDLADSITTTGRSYNALAGNIIKRIKHKTYFDTETLCYEDWLVSFHNGYYNVRTGKFHIEGDKSFCYEIPHDYNKGLEADCPKFKKLLSEWLGNTNPVRPEDMFEMMGYSMTMNTDMKMAFFIYGASNTGKTQFQTILEGLIGHQNRCEVSLQRMGRDQFGSHGIQFKLLNMVGDMSDLSVKDVSMFKQLTGDDVYVGAEVKGGDQYKFRNIVKIWYNGNGVPILDNDDDAFYGRWTLIHFPNVFNMYNTGTIKRIGKKIADDPNEIQGIIHECIKGLHRLYKRQYFRREIIENTKFVWRYEAEPLFAFIRDACTKDEESEISVFEFRSRFNKFLYMKKMKPYSARLLNDRLEKHGIYKDRLTIDGEKEYCYIGIRWKEDLDNMDRILGKDTRRMDDFVKD